MNDYSHNLPQRVEKYPVPDPQPRYYTYADSWRDKEKNPVLALLLSIIPGIGQFYNGQVGKGIFFLFFGWIAPLWIFNLVDAYFSAKRFNLQLEQRKLRAFHHALSTPQPINIILPSQPKEQPVSPVPAPPTVPSIPERTSNGELVQRGMRPVEKLMFAGITISSLSFIQIILIFLRYESHQYLLPALIGAVVGGLMAAFGWNKNRTEKNKQLLKERTKQEKAIIEAARRRGGRLSVLQLVAETDLSIDGAEDILQRFARKGLIDVVVQDSGMIEYRFYDVEPSTSNG